MSVITTDSSRQVAADWLDAAPFRAHAHHLMSVGGLSADELAVLARVSLRAMHHLVHGRQGRPARRISPQNARRLFMVTPLEASLVRSRLVPAETVRGHLEQFAAAGWSAGRIASAVGLTAAAVEELLDGRRETCPQIVALRAAAVTTAAEADHLLPMRVTRAA